MSHASTVANLRRYERVAAHSRLLILFVAVLAVAGCRSARNSQLELMERELRQQEDYIYELEDYLVEYSQKLRSCRCAHPHSVVVESKSKRKPNLATDPINLDDFEEEPLEDLIEAQEDAQTMPDSSDDGYPAVPPLEDDLPADDEPFSPEELDIPDLEIGEPVGSTARPLPLQPISTFDTQKDSAGLDVFDGDAGFEDAQSLVESAGPAEQIVIVDLFRDASESDSPLGLLTVVEARDDSGRATTTSGKISLMVMSVEDDLPRRLVRWDFTPEETSASWQTSHLGTGFHLQLPLENALLPETLMELWVRLVTEDGEKLLVKSAFAREDLLALEADTGARELPAPGRSEEPSAKLAQVETTPSQTESAELASNAAAEPEQRNTEASTRGWRRSSEQAQTVHSTASTVGGTSGNWLPLKKGRDWPVATAGTAQATASPVWTAGHTTKPTAAEQTQPTGTPQWQPFR